MKRNSRIIFKHSFGQFIEDNVEPPKLGMQSLLIGSGRDRGERVAASFEPKLKQEVCDWRKRSLNGTVGELCPCSKPVLGNVDDELMETFQRNERQTLDQIAEGVAAMRRALSERSQAAIRRMFDGPRPFTLAALNTAGREIREARAAEIRARMVEFYHERYPYRFEELQDDLQSRRITFQRLPMLHADGTTSNVWSSDQAFAMLGGYRPDRHGPWINPAWVDAALPT